MRQLISDEPGKGGIELALGFYRDRIEDKGRLTRAGHAYKHCDPVLRDTQRHILEVVLSCSNDADILGNCCAVFGSYRLHHFLLLRIAGYLDNPAQGAGYYSAPHQKTRGSMSRIVLPVMRSLWQSGTRNINLDGFN
jgi:hypothetical protein